MPTSRSDDEENEKVHADLKELMKLTNPHGNVVMGDFNTILEEEREGKEIGKFGLKKGKGEDKDS